MRIPAFALTLALALPGAAGAAPVVIDFNTATPGGRLSAPYAEDGYTLTLLYGHYDIWSSGGSGNSRYLGVDAAPGETFSQVRLAGGVFDLTALTAIYASEFDRVSVQSSAGGLVSLTTAGVHAFSGPAWSNLTWITLGSSATIGGPGFDTIVLNTVPLPAAAWLFGGALAAVGVLRRRPNARGLGTCRATSP